MGRGNPPPPGNSNGYIFSIFSIKDSNSELFYLFYSIWSFPPRFDIYRKVPKDLTQPTFTGAISKCLCVYVHVLHSKMAYGFSF